MSASAPFAIKSVIGEITVLPTTPLRGFEVIVSFAIPSLFESIIPAVAVSTVERLKSAVALPVRSVWAHTLFASQTVEPIM